MLKIRVLMDFVVFNGSMRYNVRIANSREYFIACYENAVGHFIPKYKKVDINLYFGIIMYSDKKENIMLKKRYLDKYITSDLKDKMVFIGGPRQVGKTTLAKLIGEKYKNPVYLNWDFRDDRKKIIEEKFESDADLIRVC